MAKVLIIGTSPPQALQGRRIEASNYRTWQFLDSLIDAGHEVVLCAGETDGDGIETLRADAMPGLAAFHVVGVRRPRWRAALQKIHDDFAPDCVVAVNFFPCLYATRLATERPVWMDIYGDQITIQQVSCHRAGSDRGQPTAIRFLSRILRSGDAFSVCSEPQRHMLVGELAMAGRLNRSTFGYEFVHVVLPGASRAPERAAHVNGREGVRSQLGLTVDAFAVLWCGGYNTWTDVDTLFEGIEEAMTRNRRVHYVSVGASTYEEPGNAYERLQQMIAQSPNAARYHLLGWQPWHEVAKYYAVCDVGLSIDALHYETLYGTRTRLVEMIAAGLPVISTEGTELAALLRNAGAGLTFRIGRSEQLRDCILRLAADPAGTRHFGQAASSAAAEQFSFARTTAPLRDWVRAPKVAPDRRSRGRVTPVPAKYHVRCLLRQVAWQMTGRDR